MTRTLQQLQNVRIGEMTAEEQRLVTDDACKRLQAELERARIEGVK